MLVMIVLDRDMVFVLVVLKIKKVNIPTGVQVTRGS